MWLRKHACELFTRPLRLIQEGDQTTDHFVPLGFLDVAGTVQDDGLIRGE